MQSFFCWSIELLAKSVMSKGWGNHGAPPLKPLIHPLPQFTSVHAHFSANCLAHISAEHQFCSKLLECSLPTGVSILLTPHFPPNRCSWRCSHSWGKGGKLTYISSYQRGQALPCPDLVLSYASAPPPPHPSVRYCCGRVWRHLTYHALKPLLSWRAVWPPEAYKCVYPDQLTLVLGANVIATILFININFPLRVHL